MTEPSVCSLEDRTGAGTAGAMVRRISRETRSRNERCKRTGICPFVAVFITTWDCRYRPPQVVPNTAGGESRTVAHQAYTQFPPQKFYEMHQKAFLAKSSPDFVQPTTLWGFDGVFPGPLLVARYGEPILVRQFNELPAHNNGFGINSTTTHLHNGHTPSEAP